MSEDAIKNANLIEPYSHFGFDVSFDLQADTNMEDTIITSLEVALKTAFETWKKQTEHLGAKFSNVKWE